MLFRSFDPVRRCRNGWRHDSYGCPRDGTTGRERNDFAWHGPKYRERLAILVFAQQHGLERNPPIPPRHCDRLRRIRFHHDHSTSRVSPPIGWDLSLDRTISTASQRLRHRKTTTCFRMRSFGDPGAVARRRIRTFAGCFLSKKFSQPISSCRHQSV